jgi:hypothetical protein
MEVMTIAVKTQSYETGSFALDCECRKDATISAIIHYLLSFWRSALILIKYFEIYLSAGAAPAADLLHTWPARL